MIPLIRINVELLGKPFHCKSPQSLRHRPALPAGCEFRKFGALALCLPGRHITDCQTRLFMSFRQTETPTIAAAKAGFSTATAYRIEQQTMQEYLEERGIHDLHSVQWPHG